LTKSRMFCFRLSESDYLNIKRKADRAKLNMTAYITTAALDKPITIVEGADKVIAELKGIGKNLNQLTTLCNMGKIRCPELPGVKEQFGAIFEVILTLNER